MAEATNNQILEELKGLKKSIDALNPDKSAALTEEEKSLLERLGVTVPPTTKPESEELKLLKELYNRPASQVTIDSKSLETKLDLIQRYLQALIMVILIGLCVFIISSLDIRCNGTTNPPVSKVIYVTSPEEMDVITSAFDRVSDEWRQSKFDSVKEAVEGLDVMMGGKEHGVDQAVQTAILSHFKDDSDFLAVLDIVKKNFS